MRCSILYRQPPLQALSVLLGQALSYETQLNQHYQDDLVRDLEQLLLQICERVNQYDSPEYQYLCEYDLHLPPFNWHDSQMPLTQLLCGAGIPQAGIWFLLKITARIRDAQPAKDLFVVGYNPKSREFRLLQSPELNHAFKKKAQHCKLLLQHLLDETVELQ